MVRAARRFGYTSASIASIYQFILHIVLAQQGEKTRGEATAAFSQIIANQCEALLSRRRFGSNCCRRQT